MAKEKLDLDTSAQYVIPKNFITKGTIIGGMIKTRNAVEGAVMMVVTGYPLMQIHMPIKIKIILILLICVPLGFLGIIGVNGGPLSEFLMDFFKFKKLPSSYEYKIVAENNTEKKDTKNTNNGTNEPVEKKEKKKKNKTKKEKSEVKKNGKKD